ncbi:hypothetical protein CsSME_00028896 [Camellia sinensis var. sinensis]
MLRAHRQPKTTEEIKNWCLPHQHTTSNKAPICQTALGRAVGFNRGLVGKREGSPGRREVEWSVKGDFVAVTRKNILSILSSKFKQKFSMALSFKSWIGDSDLNCTIKVDSIRWVRPDCIILGCFLLTADGKEENYLVQVITSKDGKVIDVST